MIIKASYSNSPVWRDDMYIQFCRKNRPLEESPITSSGYGTRGKDIFELLDYEEYEKCGNPVALLQDTD